MVQAEVAERLAAAPGSRAYGVPSVKARLVRGRARGPARCPRAVFWPVPNVDSGLVELTRRDPPPRRPAAGGRLRGGGRGLRAAPQDAAGGAAPAGPARAARAEAVLRAAGVDPGLRGEALDVELAHRRADSPPRRRERVPAPCAAGRASVTRGRRASGPGRRLRRPGPRRADVPTTGRTTLLGVSPTPTARRARAGHRPGAGEGQPAPERRAARGDGYHDLVTVFHAVSLHDEVTATPARDLSLGIRGEGAGELPLDGDNLVWRAAVLLAERAGVQPRGPPRLRQGHPGGRRAGRRQRGRGRRAGRLRRAVGHRAGPRRAARAGRRAGQRRRLLADRRHRAGHRPRRAADPGARRRPVALGVRDRRRRPVHPARVRRAGPDARRSASRPRPASRTG